MDNRGHRNVSIRHADHVLSAIRTKRLNIGDLSDAGCGSWGDAGTIARKRTRGEQANPLLWLARIGKSRHAVCFARTDGFRRIGPRSCDSHPWAEVDRLYVVQADRDSRETESGVSRRGIQSV